jgi:hypothetical protein
VWLPLGAVASTNLPHVAKELTNRPVEVAAVPLLPGYPGYGGRCVACGLVELAAGRAVRCITI